MVRCLNYEGALEESFRKFAYTTHTVEKLYHSSVHDSVPASALLWFAKNLELFWLFRNIYETETNLYPAEDTNNNMYKLCANAWIILFCTDLLVRICILATSHRVVCKQEGPHKFYDFRSWCDRCLHLLDLCFSSCTIVHYALARFRPR